MDRDELQAAPAPQEDVPAAEPQVDVPPAEVLPEVVETPSTFLALVSALVESEDRLGDPDFDPAELVGDLRGKVDSIEYVLRRQGAVAGFLRELARPYLSKAAAIDKNRERLRAYVTMAMKTHGIERIPGHAFRVELAESPPSLVMSRPAEPSDMQSWPGFVDVERTYRWNNSKVKDALLDGGVLGTDFPGRIERGSWPRFTVNVPAQIESKKKKGSKK